MYMTLDFLTSYVLYGIPTDTLGKSNFTFNPTSISLFDGKNGFIEGSINIGKLSDIPDKLPVFKERTCIICINDCKIADNLADRADNNICFILVPEKVSVADIFAKVRLPFTRLFANMDALIDFTVLASKGESNVELMEKVSSILNCSAALLNTYFRVLGASVISDDLGKSWDTIQQKYYYPDTNTISLLHPTSITVLDPSNNIVTTSPEFFPEEGDAFLVINSTSLPHTVLGYLLIHYTSKTNFISLMDIMHFIGAAFSYRLWHNMHASTNRNMSASFMLRNILNNSSITNEEIKRQMQTINLKLSGQLCLLVIGTSSSNDESSSLNQLLTVFNSLWPNDIVFPYEGDIIALISNFESYEPRRFFAPLEEKLEEYDLYAGYSKPFKTIGKLLYNRYIRAISAARVGRMWQHNPRYLNYSDIAMLHYVYEGSKYENQKSLVDPALIAMLDMDKEKGTDYTYTMKAYWYFNQDINKTCDFLHIHRNTLFYRLKKIREILGQDITIIQSSIPLRLSISILETLGEDEVPHFPPNIPD